MENTTKAFFSESVRVCGWGQLATVFMAIPVNGVLVDIIGDRKIPYNFTLPFEGKQVSLRRKT